MLSGPAQVVQDCVFIQLPFLQTLQPPPPRKKRITAGVVQDSVPVRLKRAVGQRLPAAPRRMCLKTHPGRGPISKPQDSQKSSPQRNTLLPGKQKTTIDSVHKHIKLIDSKV